MKHAFSLVELSIVLVILGLLTGGILTGQSLIRAAELRSVTTEFQAYQTAIFTFRDKYFALPGDMRNATAFWGAADGGDGLSNDCEVIESTGRETCNGNGNGRIADENSISEGLRAWQHLQNAGLIAGQFTGAPATAGGYVAGQNVPASRNGQAIWGFCHPTSRQYGAGDTLRLVHATNNAASNECSLRGPAGLKPEEAYGIDVKMDDGLPGTGRVLTLRPIVAGSFATCVTGNGRADQANTSSYVLTSQEDTCLMQFLMQ